MIAFMVLPPSDLNERSPKSKGKGSCGLMDIVGLKLQTFHPGWADRSWNPTVAERLEVPYL